MLEVKESRIKGAGKGLFTTSRIRKGDIIVEYKGLKSSWSTVARRYGRKLEKARYLFYISEKNVVDAQPTPEALARYANDAEAPIKGKKSGFRNNSYYKVIKGKPYIIAAKTIGPGSEIYVDYAGDYWEVWKKENE